MGTVIRGGCQERARGYRSVVVVVVQRAAVERPDYVYPPRRSTTTAAVVVCGTDHAFVATASIFAMSGHIERFRFRVTNDLDDMTGIDDADDRGKYFVPEALHPAVRIHDQRDGILFQI
jgi:hypothetical protein